MKSTVVSLLLGAVLSPAFASTADAPAGEKVSFESDGLTLVGFLYHPAGCSANLPP